VIHKYLVALSLIAAAASPLRAQSVHAGIEAWRQGDYSGAVAIWRPLAEKGNAEAQFNLGQAYRFGRGVPINLGAAQVWYERAARKGHDLAQLTVGELLFDNGNKAAGVAWLKMAAEKGQSRAMLLYGLALFNGDGVRRDPVLGYAYASRAAALGFAPAKEALAQFDQVLPPDARRKALALASAKSAPPPSPKPTKPAQTAIAQAKPKRPAPAPSVETSGAWRVQLGAFSQRGSAEALYHKLSVSLGGRQAFYIPVGAITRLQVGPYASRAAAQAACGALKGQACFPVPAK
jgi:hypothetical protein